MKNKSGWFSTNRTDRALVAIALICLLLAALPLLSNRIYNLFFGGTFFGSGQPVVGTIAMTKNDIRYKSGDSFVWENAHVHEKVRLGDSIFTGDHSHSQVDLSEGGHLNLQSNSMVTFKKIEAFNLADLSLGHFRLAVNGDVKVAIQGKVTDIHGDNSEIQIVIKKNKKPVLRLVAGRAKLKVGKTTTTLERNEPITLNKPPPPPPPPAPVVRAQPSPSVVYTRQLYDLYDNHSGQLTMRPERRQMVQVAIPVSWIAGGKPNKIFGQLSSDQNFLNVQDVFQVPGGSPSARFKKAKLGQDYFRLSVDDTNWTQPQAVQVTARPLALPPPQIQIQPTYYLLGDQVEIHGRLTAPATISNFAVEISPTAEFQPSSTRVAWIQGHDFRFVAHHPNVIYLRARGVDSQLQVTAASTVERVEVVQPEGPTAPQMAEKEFHVFKGDNVTLAWSGAKHAAAYKIRILDHDGKTIAEKTLHSQVLHMRANQIGRFKVQLEALDRFGRKSRLARARIVVSPIAPPPVMTPIQRHVASEGTVSEKIVSPKLNYMNERYDNSRVCLEGATFTIYSSQQEAQGVASPVAMTTGLSWLGWRGSNGVGASIKTKVLSVAGAQVSPIQMEIRYLRRWILSFNPFSSLNSSQIALILGFEDYHNGSNTQLFSPHYDLIKAGVGLEFPLVSRWDTGGEFLYGYGLDASLKYEISGHIDYYLKKDWTLGAGYRIHLFQAGSNSSAPVGLPYREGYGEGYSVLTWLY